jgi:hypothetical protein
MIFNDILLILQTFKIFLLTINQIFSLKNQNLSLN